MLSAMLRAATQKVVPPANTLVWAASGDFPTLQVGGFAFAASGSSAFICGGAASAGAATYTAGTLFNGSTWSASTSMGTGRGQGGQGGSVTSGIAASGYANTGGTAVSQTYNGTAFTSITNTPVVYQYGLGAGQSSSAFIICGGFSTGFNLTSHSWNGSAWASAGTVLVANGRRYAASGGALSDALVAGGVNNTVGNLSSAEKYNGTAWSAATALPLAWSQTSGFGTSSSAFMTCGYGAPANAVATYPVYPSSSLKFNGSAWSTGPSNRTGRSFPVSGGNNSSAICVGGYFNSGQSTSTVAGNSEKLQLSTAVASNVWAGAPNNLLRRMRAPGHGTASAGLVAGGVYTSLPTSTTATPSTTAETSDGVTWSSVTSAGYNSQYSGSAGTQTSAALIGGNQPSGGYGGYLQLFNGTAWSYGANLLVAGYSMSGFGSSTSSCGVTAGQTGLPAGALENRAWLYNGSAWAATGSMSQGVQACGSAGSTTTAILALGSNQFGTLVLLARTFNGSTWTNISNATTTRTYPAVFGDSATALFSGQDSLTTNKYNGSAWSTTASTVIVRSDGPQGRNGGNSGISGGYITNGIQNQSSGPYIYSAETYYP